MEPQICRLCLRGCGSQMCLQIFGDASNAAGNVPNVAEVLRQHFWFEVSLQGNIFYIFSFLYLFINQVLPNDALSKVVCNVCWTQVSEFHQFYVSIQEAQVIYASAPKFKQDPDPDILNTSWPEEIMLPTNEMAVEGEVNTDCPSTQLNVNPLDELDLEMATFSEADIDDQKEIKLERLSPDEYLLNEADDDDDDDEDLIVTRSGRKRKRDVDSAVDKPKSVKAAKKGPAATKRRAAVKRTFKKQQWPPFCKEDEDLIKRYIVMGCELCIFLAEDFDGIRDHFKEKHPNERPYIKCCGRKLNKRCLIVEHARRHENPEYIK